LKAAMADPDNIYFVCLDEMNLARVEYYFSDFLSIMETRRKGQSGSIATSKLLSEKDFVSEDDKDNYAGLIIPDNLYIVGTVNMDETTHPFSKKVLDRANTIEFSEINLLDYSLVSNEQEIDIESTEVSNDFLRSDYIILNDCSKEDNKIISEVVEKLQEIIYKEFKTVAGVISYENANLIEKLHNNGEVEKEEYFQDGIYIKAYAPKSLAEKINTKIKKPS
ncbi:MAG: DUF3578 domain-containing protein, partial [Halanaerobium sp.]